MTKHHYTIGCDETKDYIALTVEEGRQDNGQTEKLTIDGPGSRKNLGSVSLSALWKGPILLFLMVSIAASVVSFGCPQHKNSSSAFQLWFQSMNQPLEGIEDAASPMIDAISSKDMSDNPHESVFNETKEKKKPNSKIEGYSFDAFVVKYNKQYDNQDEYNRRQRIFNDNLSTILRHNANIGTGKSQANWKMGINRFADHLPDEIPLGLDKWTLHNGKMDANHVDASVPAGASARPNPADGEEEDSPSSSARAALLASLPESVDWRGKGVTTPVKNQGHCGSCWAFASTAALESHVALRTGKLFEFSVQELVTCAPNPNHCGGTGGCGGSTAELAYEFLSSGRGVVTEWEWSYTSGTKKHEEPTCHLPADQNVTIPDAVAAIDGYVTLPMNDYEALLAAVATFGPVTVSVAAGGWALYDGGIYHDKGHPSASRDINHLVVVEGYGTETVVVDAATGKEESYDYWLVRNSWGPLWGENGYIRLLRDPKAAENDCRPDATPADGNACVGPDDSIKPPIVKVCGTSGILYNAVYPTGGHLL